MEEFCEVVCGALNGLELRLVRMDEKKSFTYGVAVKWLSSGR